MEIRTAVLVSIPRTQAVGALFLLGDMFGAVFFHAVNPLGIDPFGDGGVLFKEARFTRLMALLHPGGAAETAARW